MASTCDGARRSREVGVDCACAWAADSVTRRAMANKSDFGQQVRQHFCDTAPLAVMAQQGEVVLRFHPSVRRAPHAEKLGNPPREPLTFAACLLALASVVPMPRYRKARTRTKTTGLAGHR